MNILDKIVSHKQTEIKETQELFPIKLLEKSIYCEAPCVSFKKYLQDEDKSGIIAEFKRASPSKGIINEVAEVEKCSVGYMQAGASALSILTDKNFFKGKNQDLTVARNLNSCPILRKDFTISEYQIIEARSIGADAILLIASILSPEQQKSFSALAQSLGMEVLLEVHNLEELQNAVLENVDIVGVNNRDLTTFETSLETSLSLSKHIPAEKLKISERGIHQPEDIKVLKEAGFEGFLIGELFMASSEPVQACRHFIEKIQRYKFPKINS